MRKSMTIVAATALSVMATAQVFSEQTNMKAEEDRKRILQHIHGIFQAYLRQDREAIRKTHTPDWTGFQGPSTKIERGIGDYMINAEKSLQNLRGSGYELLDTEIQFYGDLALVYYVARYDYRDAKGRDGSIPLRSIDVYRREHGEWNQCGSHITPIPTAANWGEGENAKSTTGPDVSQSNVASDPLRIAASQPRNLTARERDELLGVREAVWRAWFAGDEVELRSMVPTELIAMDVGVAEWAGQEEVIRRAVDFAAGARLTRLEFPRTQMQAYGDVAILYTTFLFETAHGDERKTTSGRGTEIFVKRNGRWLNSGWHLERDGLP